MGTRTRRSAIQGLGIDVVEIDRIAQALSRHGDRFIERIAHAVELRGAPKTGSRRVEYWAARFAAKEAFAKALGTGIGRQVPWRSVGVVKDRAGKPSLTFSPALAKALKRRGIEKAHVALTHGHASAIAVVILE